MRRTDQIDRLIAILRDDGHTLRLDADGRLVFRAAPGRGVRAVFVRALTKLEPEIVAALRLGYQDRPVCVRCGRVADYLFGAVDLDEGTVCGDCLGPDDLGLDGAAVQHAAVAAV